MKELKAKYNSFSRKKTIDLSQLKGKTPKSRLRKNSLAEVTPKKVPKISIMLTKNKIKEKITSLKTLSDKKTKKNLKILKGLNKETDEILVKNFKVKNNITKNLTNKRF